MEFMAKNAGKLNVITTGLILSTAVLWNFVNYKRNKISWR